MGSKKRQQWDALSSTGSIYHVTAITLCTSDYSAKPYPTKISSSLCQKSVGGVLKGPIKHCLPLPGFSIRPSPLSFFSPFRRKLYRAAHHLDRAKAKPRSASPAKQKNLTSTGSRLSAASNLHFHAVRSPLSVDRKSVLQHIQA